MADINNMENWHGPCKSSVEAIEDIKLKCGDGYDALLWGRGGRFYINDGIDPDTGKKWRSIPIGSRWVRV